MYAYLASFLGKYGLRATGAIAAVCAALALYWYVGSLRAENAALRASTAAVAASRDAERANAAINRDLVAKLMGEERRRDKTITRLTEELRRERVPVPTQCEPVFAPIRRALDGVRNLRAARGGGP